MDTDKIKLNLRAYYDKEAELRNKGGKQDWKKKEREFFCARAKNESKADLLEIGAGTGQDSLYFMQRGFNVTAINFSGEMVRICREKSINASVMDFYDIANLGRTYHCIWAMNCLLHVPKPDLHKVLCGINAVLSDGGLFFMGVYGGADIEREKTDLAICDMPRFFSFYSESSLKGLLADIFDILAFRQYSIGGTYDFQSVTMRKKRSSGSFE